MFKKSISFILTITLCLSFSVSALASDHSFVDSDSDVTVVNLSNSISTQELQEITSFTSAYITQNDGTVVPVDSTVTIEDISVPNYFGSVSPAQNGYKVTLSTKASDEKIVSDSGDKNGSKFNASATLQMIWIDGPQLSNVIKEVSGTLKVVKGKVTSGEVRRGDGWKSALLWESRNVGSKSSFSYSPKLTVPCPKADYSIGPEGALASLTLTVSSSVLQ